MRRSDSVTQSRAVDSFDPPLTSMQLHWTGSQEAGQEKGWIQSSQTVATEQGRSLQEGVPDRKKDVFFINKEPGVFNSLFKMSIEDERFLFLLNQAMSVIFCNPSCSGLVVSYRLL